MYSSFQVWISRNESLVYSDTLESGSVTRYSNTSKPVQINVDSASSAEDEDHPHTTEKEYFQPERIQFSVPYLKPNVRYCHFFNLVHLSCFVDLPFYWLGAAKIDWGNQLSLQCTRLVRFRSEFHCDNHINVGDIGHCRM